MERRGNERKEIEKKRVKDEDGKGKGLSEINKERKYGSEWKNREAETKRKKGKEKKSKRK